MEGADPCPASIAGLDELIRRFADGGCAPAGADIEDDRAGGHGHDHGTGGSVREFTHRGHAVSVVTRYDGAVANEDPALSRGPNKNVVWSFPIIRKGLIYVVDVRNGLFVLRYTGAHAREVDRVGFLEGNSNLGDAGRLDKSAR